MEYPKHCTGTAKGFINEYGQHSSKEQIQDFIDILRESHEAIDPDDKVRLKLACIVDFFEQSKASIDQVTKTLPRSFFEGLNPNN